MPPSAKASTDPLPRLQALLARGDMAQAAACAHELLKEAGTWHAEGRYDEQREACELVLAVLPEHYEALHLLGFNAQARGDMQDAEAYFTRSVAAKPDYAFARLALAQMRMMRTHFAEGRDLYEARFDAVTEGSGPDWRGLPIARWRGEPLKDKKLYLWAEQGLGDIVMFAGFLPFVLAQSPARVALGMFPKLISLFARSFPRVDVEPVDDAVHLALGPSVAEAFPQIEKLLELASVPFSIEPLRAAYDYARRHGPFDFAAPMGDLLVYAMPGFIPAQHPSPYLVPDPARVAEIRKRLVTAGQGRRIGISWHTTNRREQMRNLPLEEWLPLLGTTGCHFVSLQHHVSPQEIEHFCARHGCRIAMDCIDLLADAEGLAALVAAMDGVVTIDNSNAHLAGALGVPTALLLPKGCNYRWPMLEGGATLWYKTVATLRQSEAFDWSPVMREAADWLRNLV